MAKAASSSHRKSDNESPPSAASFTPKRKRATAEITVMHRPLTFDISSAGAAAAAAATPATSPSTPATGDRQISSCWLEEHLSVRDNTNVDPELIDGAAHNPHLHHARKGKRLVSVRKMVEKHKETDYMFQNPSPQFEVLNRCDGARIYDPERPRMKFWCPNDVPFQSKWVQHMKDQDLIGDTGVLLWMFESNENGQDPQPLEPYRLDSVKPYEFVIVAPDAHGTELRATAYVVGPPDSMPRYERSRRSGWVILRDVETVDMKRTDFRFRPHTRLHSDYDAQEEE